MHNSLGGAGLGHTVVNSIRRYTVGCAMVPVAVCQGTHWPASLSLRGTISQALAFLWEARFIPWRLRRPFWGNADGARGIFGSAWRILATALRQVPPKKRSRDIVVELVRRTTNTDLLPAFKWDTLWAALLVSTRIWSDVSWLHWQSVKVNLDWHPRASWGRPPGSNPTWSSLVYRLAPDAPFWGNADGARIMFGSAGRVWASALRLDLPKRLCATLVWLVGRMTNIDFLPTVEPDSFGWTLLPAVLTLLFCIYVLFVQYPCST